MNTTLRAGPLELRFDAGDLRYLKLGECEVIRRIYAAVRDRNWGTVPSEISDLKCEISALSFRIAYTSRHRQNEIHFVWQAEIAGEADGSIDFSFDGEAKTTFFRNRIGFCVLHPIRECAGARCRALYADGSGKEFLFPDTIAAEQPVNGLHDLAGLAHQIEPGVWAALEFDLRITDCRFYTGDDSIAGNYVEDGVIERCVINSSCNGVRLIGPARRLAFTHCEFFGPGRFPHRTSDRTNMLAALCLQPSAWGKEEGPMEDVSARHCTMRDVACAFHIVTKPGNTAQRLTFERIKATGIYPDSAYAAVAREVFAEWSRDPDDWQKARGAIEARWGESDLCPQGAHEPANFDAKLNGGFIMIGLLYGKGDLARTLKIVADCRQQVRENSAAAAGVLGAWLGAKELCRAAGVDEAAINNCKIGDRDLATLVRGCELVARKNVGALRMDGQAATPPPRELEQMHAAFNRRQLQQWNAATAAVFFDKMPQWDADWELVSTGYDGAPSLRKFQGKPAVLVTHPVDKVEPAVIQRTVQLPARNPRLMLTVASFPDAATDDKKSVADWLLRVVVNGKPIFEKVIDTEDRWEELSADLSRYAGQTVVLALENAPGGTVEFAYETAYWASAKIVGE